MKTRVASVLLIMTGIVILLFPRLSELYYDHQRQKLMGDWQSSMQQIHNGDEADQIQMTAAHPPVVTPTIDMPPLEPIEEEAAPEQKNEGDLSSTDGMEGILIIEKIDLQLPILHGVTEENMKTTVASIANTGKAGEVGNYAIAGHRNYTYGRNFNRLDELKENDKILVQNDKHTFAYTVTQKLYVKPEDVWVLEPNGVDREITLITCHPMRNPTHRLIIKGKVIER